MQAVIPGDIISNQEFNSSTVGERVMPNPIQSGLSDKPETRGQLLWIAITAPSGNVTRNFGPVDAVNRIWTMEDGETMQWIGQS
jgi:hypothetical protein